MPYTKNTWANGDPTKPLNAARLNNLETQYEKVEADIVNPATPLGASLSATIVEQSDPVATRKARLLGALLSQKPLDAFPPAMLSEPLLSASGTIGGSYTKVWKPTADNTGIGPRWSGYPNLWTSAENPTYDVTGPSGEAIHTFGPGGVAGTTSPSYWEWFTDAPYFATIGSYNPGSPVWLEIDGESLGSGALAAPNNKYWIFNWNGVRKLRRYRVYSGDGFRLGGIVTSILDSVVRPPSRKPTLGMMTDSYGQGSVAAGGPPLALPYIIGELVGFEVCKSSIGGSGYQTEGPIGAGAKFIDRVALFNGADIDAMLWMGGINDSATGLQAAAEACYAAFAAAHPGVPQIAVGPWSPSGPTETANAAKWTAIIAACAAQGVSFIDNRGWITGTGRAGTTDEVGGTSTPNLTGDGNADILIGDGTHLKTPVGQRVIGTRVASQLSNILLERTLA